MRNAMQTKLVMSPSKSDEAHDIAMLWALGQKLNCREAVSHRGFALWKSAMLFSELEQSDASRLIPGRVLPAPTEHLRCLDQTQKK